VIKANDDLTPEHHQFFLYQMLRGLKYIHTGQSFHTTAGICVDQDSSEANSPPGGGVGGL